MAAARTYNRTLTLRQVLFVRPGHQTTSNAETGLGESLQKEVNICVGGGMLVFVGILD
jgi:hypothetical protein